jgi:hypothetical protein
MQEMQMGLLQVPVPDAAGEASETPSSQ